LEKVEYAICIFIIDLRGMDVLLLSIIPILLLLGLLLPLIITLLQLLFSRLVLKLLLSRLVPNIEFTRELLLLLEKISFNFLQNDFVFSFLITCLVGDIVNPEIHTEPGKRAEHIG